MVKLTSGEKEFLAHHKIPDSALFDATGMKKAVYHDQMKRLGKTVALNTTPCKKQGHRIRTRNGTCMQCNVAAHTYLMRHINSGQVYVAGSKKGKFIKIGTSKDFREREISLNDFGYGGVTDWKMIYCVSTKTAGSVEFEAQKEIASFAHHATFFKDHHDVNCLELFKCRFSRVQEIINEVVAGDSREVFLDAVLAKWFDQIDEINGEHIRFAPSNTMQRPQNADIKLIPDEDLSGVQSIEPTVSVSEIANDKKTVHEPANTVNRASKVNEKPNDIGSVITSAVKIEKPRSFTKKNNDPELKNGGKSFIYLLLFVGLLLFYILLF